MDGYNPIQDTQEEEEMIDLNSVLLEGTLKVQPFMIMEDGQPLCKIWIKTVRRDGEKIFEVRVKGDIARLCDEHLKEGKRIRAVGQLDFDDYNGNVFVLAEHIEFKPDITRFKGQDNG